RELAPRGDRRLAPRAAGRRTVLADRAQLGEPGQGARPVARVRLGLGARRVELGDLRVESFEDDAGLLERPHEAPAAPQDVAHEEERPDERADHEGRPHERPEHGPTLLRPQPPSSGRTRVPSSSMHRMRRSCGIAPIEYLTSTRLAPSSSAVARILAATVSGEPTRSAPSGPTSCAKRPRWYAGQPRSRPIALVMAAKCGYASSRACSSVSAM